MNDVIRIALASTDDDYINGLLPSLKSAFGDKVLFVSGNDSLKKSKSELNFNLINFWSEFDAVFYVGNKNNQYDSFLDYWVGHTHFRFIDSQNTIDDINRETNCILSNIEFEKKYLIKMPDFSQLSKYKIFKTDIEQVYLPSKTVRHRVRKRGADGVFMYVETRKIRINGEKCFEYENIITESRYNELVNNAGSDGHKISKSRYCLLYESQYFELDVFPFWKDRALIELEISDENRKISFPPEIEVLKDVSNDGKYKNIHLSTVDWNNYEDTKAYLL